MKNSCPRHLKLLAAPNITLALSLAFAAAASGQQPKRLGAIDFYGYKGLDTNAIRTALPFREGDIFPSTPQSVDQWKQAVKQSVRQVTGRNPTDVAMVCCDDHGDRLIYIGLAGTSSGQVAYNPVPNGASRLPSNVVQLNEELEEALKEAVSRGTTGEDRSQGYALSEDATTRSKELAMRDYALHNEATILHVLESSGDAAHRGIAATLMGYARQTKEQISALVGASFDPDGTVRNNAVRALGVLVESKPETASQIPAAKFVALLRSGRFSDRNKAVFLLAALSKTREPEILQQLRSQALAPLIEMARWQWGGHALKARIILARMAGVEETRWNELFTTEPVKQMIEALQPVP